MYRKLIPFVVVVAMCACAVTYYPTQDSFTVRGLEALQKTTDSFYVKAAGALHGGEKLDSAEIEGFYITAERQVGMLLTRAETFLHNKEMVNGLKLLRDNFQLAAELHSQGFNSELEIGLVRELLASQFRALLSLERAKPLPGEMQCQD